MSKKIGIFFIALGVLCLCLAIGLNIHNMIEEKKSEEYKISLLEDLKGKINTEATNTNGEMGTVLIDDYESIGILSIPALELEFPVLTDWNYEKLEKAPCLYFGSYYEENFVIAAHNYKSHFGRLKELKKEDLITFTDVSGHTYYYEVVLTETLPKYATEDMVTSGFDLSLYTCTLGGENRVTVRCDRVK